MVAGDCDFDRRRLELPIILSGFKETSLCWILSAYMIGVEVHDPCYAEIKATDGGYAAALSLNVRIIETIRSTPAPSNICSGPVGATSVNGGS